MKRVKRISSSVTIGFNGLVSSKDPYVTDMSKATRARGFAFSKGALTGKIGIDKAVKYNGAGEFEALKANQTLKDIFLFRLRSDGEDDFQLVAQTSDGEILKTPLFREGGFESVAQIGTTGDITEANINLDGNDYLLLCSKDKDLLVLTKSAAMVNSEAPHFSTVAVYNERVFGGVEGVENQVWFSDDFDPFNWKVSLAEAGYLNFNDEGGRVTKVISMHGHLYIFREYGIYRLTAYSVQSEFILKKVISDTGIIYAGSIEACGDCVIFFAEKGLFLFDGYNVKRVANELPEIKCATSVTAAYLNGNYYMAVGLEDEKKNDCVIRYDVRLDSISILFGVEVTKLKAFRMNAVDDVVCLVKTPNGMRLGRMSESGAIFDEATEKTYESPPMTAYPSKLRCIRSATFKCDGEATFFVVIDGVSFSYPVKGKGGLQTIFIDRSGYNVRFEISSGASKIRITPIRVSVDYIDV